MKRGEYFQERGRGGWLTSFCIKQTPYLFSQDMDVFHALYFSMVTLLTVGFGDFYPKTPSGVILLILFSMVGLGIIATTVSVIRYGIKGMWEGGGGERDDSGSRRSECGGIVCKLYKF